MTVTLARATALFALLFMPAVLFAQSATALTGTISDPQNASVAGARISVYPPGAAMPLRTVTDKEGRYRIPLPVGGVVMLEVAAPGFRNVSAMVTIQEGQESRHDIPLEIEGVSSSIVVTAADGAQTTDELSKAVSVVDSEEILARGEYTLAGIIAGLPGVQIRNAGGPGQLSQLRFRGLRPDASAILIDGLRFRDVASPQTDATSLLSNVNFISTDRVEALKGSGSSLYGTNAAGGVINIVTDKGGGRSRGSIQAEGGTLGFFRGRVLGSGGAFGDRLNYSAGAMHLNVTEGVDGNDATRSSGGQAYVGFALSPKSMVSLRFFGSDDFVQLNSSPGTTGIPEDNVASPGILNAVPLSLAAAADLIGGRPVNYGDATYVPGIDDPDNRRTSRHHATAAHFRQILSSEVSFEAAYQRVHTRRTLRNGPAGPGPFQPLVTNYSNFIGNIDTLDARSTIQIAAWNQLSVGYEFEREGYEDVLDNNLISARVRSESFIRQRSSAVYFQDQLHFFGSRLQVSLSGRGQFFTLEHPEFKATGVINPYGPLDLKAPPRALTGDVSMSYRMRLGTKIRAHGGNAYRGAGLYERFGGSFSRNQITNQIAFTPFGDPLLGSDRYNSFDLGIDQYLWSSRLRLSGTYFYTRAVTVTGFESFLPADDPYSRTAGYVNGPGGISRGVEADMELRPTGDLRIAGSYTYTRSNTDRPASVPDIFQTLNVPRHTFGVVVSQRVLDKLNITADVAGNSSLLFPLFVGAPVFASKAYRFAAFVKTDLSVSYDLRETDTGRLRIYTRIDNVLNRRFYDFGWLAPGAAAVGGVLYEF